MTVSPVVTRSPSGTDSATGGIATHAKILAMRNSGRVEQRPASQPTPASELGGSLAVIPEPAEQLNAAISRKYIKDKKLGEGTYAIVYLGHLRHDPASLVAIKKIKVNPEYKDGLSVDAIREVKYLQELSHPNIIALHDVFSSKDQNLNLVLEFLPLGDLEMLIKDRNIQYGAADVKAWMGMLARGVWFCHENFVLHRDIKPNNLLISSDGEVKLADFGLARSFADPYLNMTHQVITRWYRPLELLYGARQYSGAVDIWSMGMVFAELLLRVPFAAGHTDMDQISKIIDAFGTPTEENWPGVTRLPNFVPIQENQITPLQGRDFFIRQFPTAGPLGADLLASMLKLDPRKRSTARQVLQHAWWVAEPRPTRNEDLPRKAGGAKKMGDDLVRRGGEIDETRVKDVARQLDFSAMR
ncbi:serine/threonine-protein kinase crk1 [Histoplasma capsulatum]|uniref:Serine/threonine-protein kinase crk1 n=1 Tax=Ajellomyces capsulatus TaxID=5037 RepID=A0A8A1MCY9_AJECA|nr:serine/threonine-protein kinase crk1 [Histoplasma capsulatum]